jgi:FkbM family methyltransferase
MANMVPGFARARSRLSRDLFYLKHNARDVYDTYLSRHRAPRATPMGFSFGGLSSQHHVAMQAGTFEPHEVAVLSAVIEKVDVFVDVGANVGYYTCIARHLGKPAIAIEPMPTNLSVLYENLRANSWEDTEVVPMGVSDRPGVATLFGASSTGASLVDNWAGAPSLIKRHISVSTLDILLSGRFRDERLLVKVDVEGHEYPALRGAASLLARDKKPVWFVEISLQQFHPSGRNPHFLDTFDLFGAQGYATYLLSDGRLVRTGREDVVRWEQRGHTDTADFNYLFVPRDLPGLLPGL